MGILLLLLLLALLVVAWQRNMAARETAAAAARDICQRQSLQMLDGTVALQQVRLTRNHKGHVVLRRVFQFNYSPEGASRQTGFVIMTGGEIVHIGL